AADEEPKAEPLLERLHAVANRARRDMKLLCGRLETRQARSRFEQAERGQRRQSVSHGYDSVGRDLSTKFARLGSVRQSRERRSSDDEMNSFAGDEARRQLSSRPKPSWSKPVTEPVRSEIAGGIAL